MPTTKTPFILVAVGTVLVPATPQSGTASLSTGDGALITIKITNGALPPTLAASATIRASHDGGATYKLFAMVVSDVLANSVREWNFIAPKEVANVEVVFADNTDQNCTVEALGTNTSVV